MNINTIRHSIIIVTSILIFHGAQTIPSIETGLVQPMFDSLIIALINGLLHFLMWSDYNYNLIIEDGLKLSYRLFQFIGLIFTLFMLFIILNIYS
jgi:hypothetical protein